MKISIDEVKRNHKVKTYIQRADESLSALGFTEHSFAHVTLVAEKAKEILTDLGYPQRDAELAEIAGYLHDIGNVINRIEHAQSGAVMAFRILDEMGFDPDDVATVVTAIGNHDESTAFPVNHVAAALILADKCDVRRSRVRVKDHQKFDIHDRVNYAVGRSSVKVNDEKTEIALRLEIDTSVCTVTDYFEIFIDRMILCRKAAEALGLKFGLKINGQRLM